MDALLAAADDEASYSDDNDQFDAFDEALEHRNATPAGGPKSPVRALLQSAAADVAREERHEAEKAFESTAVSVDAEVFHDADTSLDLLVEATKEVEQVFGTYDAHDKVISSDDDKDGESGDDDGDEKSVNDETRLLNTQLFVACYKNNLADIKHFLKNGASLTARDRQGHGWTPLHWTASKGYNDATEFLIETRRKQKKKVRPFVNSKDALAGWSPLHLACVGGHASTVELLLRNKAERGQRDKLGEKAVDCLGKVDKKTARKIRTLLRDPNDNSTYYADEEKEKASGDKHKNNNATDNRNSSKNRLLVAESKDDGRKENKNNSSSSSNSSGSNSSSSRGGDSKGSHGGDSKQERK
jgi:hypothetical protein